MNEDGNNSMWSGPATHGAVFRFPPEALQPDYSALRKQIVVPVDALAQLTGREGVFFASRDSKGNERGFEGKFLVWGLMWNFVSTEGQLVAGGSTVAAWVAVVEEPLVVGYQSPDNRMQYVAARPPVGDEFGEWANKVDTYFRDWRARLGL